MSNSGTDEKDSRPNSRERLDNLLDVLEKRIDALLDENDLELMKPYEIEQAALNYIEHLLRLFELRLKYVESGEMDDNDSLLETLYGSWRPKPVTNADSNE